MYFVLSGTNLAIYSLPGVSGYVVVLTQEYIKQTSELTHKPRIITDVTTFLYADKIRMLHFCGSLTSTHVTPSPLAPLAMSLLTVYFVCLSIIMLNPLNAPCQYKPFSYISQYPKRTVHCVMFISSKAASPHECGSLSPRHGASSGCGWRNSYRYGG
jgi:hypothetical protein